MEREKLIETVNNAQSGDQQAVSLLFNHYYDSVYQFALKTVKDPEIAADVTQESFIEVINTLGTLREPAAFPIWLRKITYHQCTRFFKKIKDITVAEDEDGNTVFDDLEEDHTDFIPEAALDRKDLQDTLHQILDELPEDMRSIVVLYYYDELSYREISEITGLPEVAIKRKLFTARKKLKNSVEQYEKKHNIKLHSIGLAPLLLWFWNIQKQTASSKTVVQTAAQVSSATGANITVATTGAAVKTLGTSLTVKIAAGVLTASLVGGGIAVVTQSEPEIPPSTTTSTLSQEKPSSTLASIQSPESQGLQFDSKGDGTCWVTGIGSCTDTTLMIPSQSPSGEIVVGIDEAAFQGCILLEYVVLPQSILTIGDSAFADCTNLFSIELPQGLVHIGAHAFSRCVFFESVVIPDSVTNLGAYAFMGCKELNSVTIGNGLTQLEEGVFYLCVALPQLSITKNISYIGSYALGGCYALKEIKYAGTKQEWDAIQKEEKPAWDWGDLEYLLRYSDN